MSDTDLKTIVFAPGVIKDTTEYSAEGGWVDSDKIRFHSGNPEKIGGWVRETVSLYEEPSVKTFTGVSRKLLTWTDLSSAKYLASASHTSLELLYGNQVYDITPVRTTVSLTNKITTTSGLSVVEIEDTSSHSLVVGDYVYVVSQATPVDGITLSGRYLVTVVTSSTKFKIDSGTAASGTTASGGGALEIDYLLPTGYADAGNITGWGGGTWGTEGEAGGGYNRPRSGTGGLRVTLWSLETWGEDLLACRRGGPIYHWDKTSGVTVRSEELANVPSENTFILVSRPSRHLIAFGSEVFATSVFDPLIIRWAEQETLDGWAITANNTAGEFRLPSGNRIIGAVQTKSEILIFTETDLYSMRYIGGNDVFAIEPLGTNISAISQNSFVDINGIVYWQGRNSFFMYDGSVNILPSTMEKFIFDQDGEGRLNANQREKIHAGVNKEFNEIWFFYPRYDDIEINCYVKYNIKERVWDHGTMNRTAWVDKGVFDKPYGINPAGTLYVHESGKDDDAIPMEAYIRSAYFDMNDGSDIVFLDRLLPDVKLPMNRNIEITLYSKKFPHPAASVKVKGPYYFDDSDTQINPRVRGRQISVKYAVTATGADFEIGKVRFGIQADGGR